MLSIKVTEKNITLTINLNSFSIRFCLLSFLAILFCCEAHHIQKPYELSISEGFKNPIGFYNATPSFSWKLPISKNVLSQSSYQIIVASSKDLLLNNPDLWDSKKQESEQSTFIKYKGQQLQSRQKAYWQVRYWNQNGSVSAWSEINHFEIGLLKNTDWKAKWVG